MLYFKLKFTPCNDEQTLQHIELKEKNEKKEKEEKHIGELIRKEPEKKVPINSSLKAVSIIA